MVRVCRIISIHRSLWYYQSRKDDTAVIDRLNELAEQLPSRGSSKEIHPAKEFESSSAQGIQEICSLMVLVIIL